MNRKPFILVALLFVLLLSACVTPVMDATPPASEPEATKLSVLGIGKVSLTPDIAYMEIGVDVKNPDMERAIEQNNAAMERVVKALKAAGVDEKDIKTSNFSAQPITLYDRVEPEQTYQVYNTLSVTVRDLEQVSALIETAFKAGATSVYSVRFEVEDTEAALVESRKLALENARAQADEMAALLGLKVEGVSSLEVSNSYAQPIYMDTYLARGGGEAPSLSMAPPIQEGTQTVEVTVRVEYLAR